MPVFPIRYHRLYTSIRTVSIVTLSLYGCLMTTPLARATGLPAHRSINTGDITPSSSLVAEARASALEVSPGQDDGSSLTVDSNNGMPDAPDGEIGDPPQTIQNRSMDMPTPIMADIHSDHRVMELSMNGRQSRLGAPTIPADIANLLPAGGVNNIATGLSQAPLNTQYAPQSQQDTCTRWIPEAESYYGIPQGILRAVNLVESGGYPWTLNIGGSPYYADNIQDALTHIRGRNGLMRTDVAVGCMQLFTRYHSDQFQDSAHMIDPRTNVMYAAYYLSKLHAMYHSWQEAVARYHSPTAEHQRIYLCQVVNRRIRLGFQNVNEWYQQTCGGGNTPTMGRKPIQFAQGY